MPDSTRKIVLFDPDEELLTGALAGRSMSPGLAGFLQGLVRTKRWARKINIPSGDHDLAAVLVFTSALRDAGLEITSEVHVYFRGEVMVERWEVAGENERIALLPKEAFRVLDIAKVRLSGDVVEVLLNAPTADGAGTTLLKHFDFAKVS